MVDKPILLEVAYGKKKRKTRQKENALQPGRKAGDYRRYFPERNSNFHEFKAKKSIRFNQAANRRQSHRFTRQCPLDK